LIIFELRIIEHRLTPVDVLRSLGMTGWMRIDRFDEEIVGGFPRDFRGRQRVKMAQ
jgi:hypothetical protein